MDAVTSDQIVQMVSYEIVGPYQAFSESLALLAARTGAEEPAILRYTFYVSADRNTAESLIVYRDASAWVRRHETVSGYEEYHRFNATVRATRIRLFGPLTPRVVDWLSEREVVYEHCQFERGWSRP
jgi:hypothetical protein